MQTDSKSAYLTMDLLSTLKQRNDVALKSNLIEIKWLVSKKLEHFIETLLYDLNCIFEGERHIIDIPNFRKLCLIFPKMNYEMNKYCIS